MSVVRRICVFCGSSTGLRPAYRHAAVAIGEELAQREVGLVYGGGNVGLMGIAADAALALGGEVIGVIPERLMSREIAHQGVTDLRVVRTMHERKALMAELSVGFVALPGGFGTFEEFCEVLTWSQLGIHKKPCGLLNVAGYYDPLLQLFDQAVSEGFVKPASRSLVIAETEPSRLVDQILSYFPEPIGVPIR